MKYIYVKYTDKNLQPKGSEYLYQSDEAIIIGDIVLVPMGNKEKTAIVTQDALEFENIRKTVESYQIKPIIGLKSEVITNATEDTQRS